MRTAEQQRLTECELAILRLLRVGRTNSEIAGELSTTVSAIKWRVHRMFAKLHARNRIEAIARALERMDGVASEPLPKPGPMPERLTKVELEILRRLRDGRINREIANDLAMASGTVSWYLLQIYGKLQARNRVEALARAVETGCLTSHSLVCDNEHTPSGHGGYSVER
jgi:DNA-binding NarL/FixJ family response regulator